MQKDELIETIDTFIEKNRDMLKFTASDKLIDGNGNIINGRNGWEKWLQFQFAKYLSENKYKQITVENKFERNNTKNKDKTLNYIDITFKGPIEKCDCINALEFKVNKSPSNLIDGIKRDLEGIYEIKKTDFCFRSVTCIGFFLSDNFDNPLKKNITFAILKHFESDNCRYASLSENIEGWRYLIVHWTGKASDSDDNYKSFTEFKRGFFDDLKRKIKEYGQ